LYFVQLRIAKVNTEDTDNFLQHLCFWLHFSQSDRGFDGWVRTDLGFSPSVLLLIICSLADAGATLFNAATTLILHLLLLRLWKLR
ncbi:MAG: hypothetical protein MZU97_00075, partial [Bacillus subtilis]|nr:hypothetical protein [Bacillus subtilis]